MTRGSRWLGHAADQGAHSGWECRVDRLRCLALLRSEDVELVLIHRSIGHRVGGSGQGDQRLLLTVAGAVWADESADGVRTESQPVLSLGRLGCDVRTVGCKGRDAARIPPRLNERGPAVRHASLVRGGSRVLLGFAGAGAARQRRQVTSDFRRGRNGAGTDRGIQAHAGGALPGRSGGHAGALCRRLREDSAQRAQGCADPRCRQGEPGDLYQVERLSVVHGKAASDVWTD